MGDREGRLTDAQVENWRKVLLGTLGPYALMMTREQIQAYRDRMQSIAQEIDGELPVEESEQAKK